MQLHQSWVLLMTPRKSCVHLQTAVARLFDPLIQPIPIPLLPHVVLPKYRLVEVEILQNLKSWHV